MITINRWILTAFIAMVVCSRPSMACDARVRVLGVSVQQGKTVVSVRVYATDTELVRNVSYSIFGAYHGPDVFGKMTKWTFVAIGNTTIKDEDEFADDVAEDSAGIAPPADEPRVMSIQGVTCNEEAPFDDSN